MVTLSVPTTLAAAASASKPTGLSRDMSAAILPPIATSTAASTVMLAPPVSNIGAVSPAFAGWDTQSSMGSGIPSLLAIESDVRVDLHVLGYGSDYINAAVMSD